MGDDFEFRYDFFLINSVQSTESIYFLKRGLKHPIIKILSNFCIFVAFIQRPFCKNFFLDVVFVQFGLQIILILDKISSRISKKPTYTMSS